MSRPQQMRRAKAIKHLMKAIRETDTNAFLAVPDNIHELAKCDCIIVPDSVFERIMAYLSVLIETSVCHRNAKDGRGLENYPVNISERKTKWGSNVMEKVGLIYLGEK